MNCNQIIEYVYTHPRIVKIIAGIKPYHLQSDLRQEFAIVMLEYDCNKLLEMYRQDKLISFSMRVIWKMGTLPNSAFYKTFRKNNYLSLEYDIEDNMEEDIADCIEQAEYVIEKKFFENANQMHEAMIFTKYIEMESCQKVAKYFNIPRLHVFQIVKKVRQELKTQFK